jgi:hypothetical protein
MNVTLRTATTAATAGSRKYEAIGSARARKAPVSSTPSPSIEPARLASCSELSVRSWMMIASRPMSSTRRAKPIGTVAIATRP